MIRDVIVIVAFFLYLVLTTIWCVLCKVLHNEHDVEIVEKLKKDD